MAVSLPPSKPQEGCQTLLPVGAVVTKENRPRVQASLLPTALREGSSNSPKKTAILAVQAGKAPKKHNVLGGEISTRGGYGLHQRKDTENPRFGSDLDNKSNNNHDSSSSCDQKRDKVDAQGIIAAPARPTSARKRSNNGLRELRASVGVKLSKLFGLGGGSSGRESPPPGSPREAATAALLPWKAHENLSKMLDYRPRGHGQAFLDIYEVGAVLGSGGFAVVLEGK